MASYVNTVLADGPTYLWMLNERKGTGSNAVSLAQPNSLTYGAGTTKEQIGPPGMDLATQFAGAASSVCPSGSHNQVYAGPCSIECWFKTSAAGGLFANSTATSGGNPVIGLYVGSDGKVYFGIFNTGVVELVSAAVVDDGNWHYVAGVIAANQNMALYVDGAAAVTNANSVAITTGETFWQIGDWSSIAGWTNNSVQWLTGFLTGVAVYNTVALTAQQAATHFALGQAASAVPESFLVPLGV